MGKKTEGIQFISKQKKPSMKEALKIIRSLFVMMFAWGALFSEDFFLFCVLIIRVQLSPCLQSLNLLKFFIQ
jgi:hypothetical protein